MKKIFFLTLFCFSALFAQNDPSAKTIFVYDKSVNEVHTATTWVLEANDDSFQIKGQSPRGTTLIVTDKNFNTKSFHYVTNDKTTVYTINRNGDTLFATSTVNGEQHTETYNIGRDIWVQEFAFCFYSFIRSNDKSFKFQIINARDLSLHEMVATKKDMENLSIDNQSYAALKVRVTLTGFKKMFWKADTWYDQKTGDMLKYMATEGPGTPLDIITMISKKTE